MQLLQTESSPSGFVRCGRLQKALQSEEPSECVSDFLTDRTSIANDSALNWPIRELLKSMTVARVG